MILLTGKLAIYGQFPGNEQRTPNTDESRKKYVNGTPNKIIALKLNSMANREKKSLDFSSPLHLELTPTRPPTGNRMYICKIMSLICLQQLKVVHIQPTMRH